MAVPKISVIIPCFNVEIYLSHCLNSVLSQSISDIELICIDDGSTDATYFKLLDLSSQDSRIKVFKQQNFGVAYARNRGINIAKGEFLAFMDPDDFYPNENCLSRLYETIESTNTAVAGGGLIFYDHKNQVFHPHHTYDCFYRFETNSIISFEDFQFDYGFTRFLYRRDFILANKLFFPALSCFEDPVFLVKALDLCKKFGVSTDVVYAYRHNHKQADTLIPDAKSVTKVQDLITGVSDVLELANKKGYEQLKNLVLSQLQASIFDMLRPNPILPDIAQEKKYEKMYQDILNSRSWRITAPLRKIMWMYRCFKS